MGRLRLLPSGSVGFVVIMIVVRCQSNIIINTKVQGFLGNHCIDKTLSVLFTSPVRGLLLKEIHTIFS